MFFITIFCLVFASGYFLLMIAYCRGWLSQKEFFLEKDYRPQTKISVIIPARNEQNNIGTCIESILAQDYPPGFFEIIVVNDHSQDRTKAIAESYNSENVHCLNLEEYMGNQKTGSYKKAAITCGVEQSKGDLIITTDADCIAPKEWLKYMAAQYELAEPMMIIAPVIYTCDNSVLQIFQLLDFMSMQGITAAAHHQELGRMCNGANLAFTKSAFKKAGGYSGVDHIATGDDYLLMMKITKLPGCSIKYLKTPGAIITTSPQISWTDLLQQRIRWASKSGKYDDKRLTIILGLVYLFNFSFLILVVAGIFDHKQLLFAGYILLAKIIIEFAFLQPVARFFKQTKMLWYFPFLQPVHIAYIIIAGFLGFKGRYRWKGRLVS